MKSVRRVDEPTDVRGLDFAGMAEYARRVGGPALRRLTFHQRALMLKEMAKYLSDRKDGLYRLSAATGATKSDSWIDIDGGIGTFFVYASKGRRELPNETFYVDGAMEALSKGGTFVGRSGFGGSYHPPAGHPQLGRFLVQEHSVVLE